MFKIVSVLTDRKVCFKISGEFRKDSRDSIVLWRFKNNVEIQKYSRDLII